MEKEPLDKVLSHLHTSMQTKINNRLKEVDLTLAQGLALIWLDKSEEGELPLKTIEKMFETSQPTTLGIINRLEQKNLINTHLTEQRRKIVKILEEGRKNVDFVKQCVDEVEEEFFQEFTFGERALFLELVKKAEKSIGQKENQDLF